MNNRNLAFVGAALLAAGLFTPIVSMPILGTVNLFSNAGNEIALAILVLAGIGAALAAKDRLGDVLWPGLGAAGILLYLFGRIQYGMVQFRESMREGLQDNPLAGLAEGAAAAIQLQWGWLVLAAGAGLLVYVGLRARPPGEKLSSSLRDNTTRAVAGLALALMLLAPALNLFARPSAGPAPTPAPGPAAAATAAVSPTASADKVDASGLTTEEAAYIRDSLQVYELEAKYYSSLLDGRIPGVRFKVKNNGGRTLNEVKVRVVFHDANGKPIAEEDYHPVLVSEYNMSGDNTPLRPNYIRQQDSGEFYSAKSVPTEWKTGAATARIVDIAFGPNE